MSVMARFSVLGVALLAASCESGSAPLLPATVSLTVDLGTSFPAATLVNRAHVLVSRAGGTVALDSMLVTSGTLSLQGLELPLGSSSEVLTARVELFSDSYVLFRGEAQLQATSGQSISGTVPMEPVIASVEVPQGLEVFTAIGDRQPLMGSALFATGDEVPGSILEWSTGDPAVAVVVEGALIESTGEGETSATAEAGGKAASIPVRVAAVVAEVAIEPAEVEVPIGSEVEVQAVPYDANENPLVRPVAWSISDASIATIDEAGLITGLNLGSTTVLADVEGLMAEAAVDVTPAPPLIAGLQAAEPGTRSVDLVVSVTPQGDDTDLRFEWSTDEAFSTVTASPALDVGDGLEPVEITDHLIQLTPSTGYFVRGVASNDYGEATSDVVAFNTADPTGGFVDGTLQSEGDPVEGVGVRLDDGPTMVTDAEGRYAFDDVALGTHTVTLVTIPEGVTFEVKSLSGELTSVGEILVLDFEGEFLRESAIEGKVSASGLALDGVTVSLSGADEGETVTDGLGRYAFDQLRSGDYEVEVSAFDAQYVSFESNTREVSVGVSETQVADFDGTDSDVLDVELYAFYGIDGVKPGNAPAGGITFGLYPNEEDARLRNHLLGSGTTGGSGTVVVRIRKRDDQGADGGAGDNKVWSGLASSLPPNIGVQADLFQAISFSDSDSRVSAPDTTDLLNGNVRLNYTIRTRQTSMPDSPYYLQYWDNSLWSDTTKSPISGFSSSHGSVQLSTAWNVDDLPVTFYARPNGTQEYAYDAEWTWSPKPAGAGSSAGRYLKYEWDGTDPPSGVNLGVLEITYTTMHFYTNVHHEVDDIASNPQRTAGDDMEGATSITIYLYQGGKLVDTRPIRKIGAINAIYNVPSFVAGSVEARSSDSTIEFITPTVQSTGGNGGGTVGALGPQGGYRHSFRLCPQRADTIIKQCSGFAYKFNNTKIRGRVRHGNGSAATGETVTVKRCRIPQPLSGSRCAAYDGFEKSGGTNSNGDYSISSLLEGTYEVTVNGVSRLAKTHGQGGAETVDLTIP